MLGFNLNRGPNIEKWEEEWGVAVGKKMIDRTDLFWFDLVSFKMQFGFSEKIEAINYTPQNFGT